MLAVELDGKWAATLRGRWPNVEVIEGDATRIRLPREPFRVVANLPFDRTTDLLRMLLDDPRAALVRADLIVEWGVAVKRGLPWPSTLNDVTWGAFYETSVERRLARIVFEPPPVVDAGLLVSHGAQRRWYHSGWHTTIVALPRAAFVAGYGAWRPRATSRASQSEAQQRATSTHTSGRSCSCVRGGPVAD